MDEDLEYSNDSLLRQLQMYKTEIGNRMTFCRDGLQSTVDQISRIEHRRELEKLRIEKEFEKTKLNMLYLLKKRKNALLNALDSEIDTKRQLLLNRVQIYQTVILEAADLEPEIIKLEKYELNNNQHLQSLSNTKSPHHVFDHISASSPKFQFNKYLKKKDKVAHTSTHHAHAPNVPPPPIPTANHTDDFMAVPSPSLHNLPIKSVTTEHKEKESEVYTPTALSKKRLILEIDTFLFVKPPAPNKPRVAFQCNRKRFVLELEARLTKYGSIASSTGSLSLDLQDSLHTGVNWVVNKTNPIVSLGSMIANGFKKRQQSKELKTIPPPLLIIYLSPVEKALAEEFAECLTVVTNQSGVIISVVGHHDTKAIQKWLDPSSIHATKTAVHAASKHKTLMHENDYAYNPDLESEISSHCGQRSVLRVCILLYGEKERSERINELVHEYETKYNLKSISGVEMKKVMDKAPTNVDEDCPHCYVGNIFYCVNDGIVEGQETIFDSIAKCVFSPNSEFDDEEINMAIDAYDQRNDAVIDGNNVASQFIPL